MANQAAIELLTDEPAETTYGELAEVLVDCVADGASVGFLKITNTEARSWWRGYLAAPQVLTWVARDVLSRRIVGTVSLDLPDKPNGLHRAEVVKLMVHRRARGQRCATRLLDAVENKALELGRTLLFLDTESGSVAERLYRAQGWARVGRVEDWAMSPRGELAATTFMSKTVSQQHDTPGPCQPWPGG
jgi:GNAT superfamily N-acetyltransferase